MHRINNTKHTIRFHTKRKRSIVLISCIMMISVFFNFFSAFFFELLKQEQTCAFSTENKCIDIHPGGYVAVPLFPLCAHTHSDSSARRGLYVSPPLGSYGLQFSADSLAVNTRVSLVSSRPISSLSCTVCFFCGATPTLCTLVPVVNVTSKTFSKYV